MQTTVGGVIVSDDGGDQLRMKSQVSFDDQSVRAENNQSELVVDTELIKLSKAVSTNPASPTNEPVLQQ